MQLKHALLHVAFSEYGFMEQKLNFPKGICNTILDYKTINKYKVIKKN